MRLFWGLVVSVLALCTEAPAQEEPRTLTADECVRLALDRNRLVRAAREQTEAARHWLKETGAQRLPRVTTTAAYSRVDDDGTSLSSSGGTTGSAGALGAAVSPEEVVTAGVSITEPLADQIGLSHAVGIARLEATIAALDQRSAEDAVAFGARQAFYMVLTYEKTVESVEQTITEFESTLKLTRSLKEAGRVLQRDVNKADIAVEQAKLELLRAQNALRSANSSLRDVLGLELDAPLSPAPTEEIQPFDIALDECVATASVQRPDLRASELQYAAARRGVSLARSAYVPSIGASVTYQWQDTDISDSEDSVTFGLSWSWDLWDWGERRSAVRGAEATKRAALLAYENERSQVGLEIERLWLAVKLAARKIEVAKKVWDYAVENVRVSREKYEAGTLLITDLLDDQTELNDSRIAYYMAIYDYAIALADLRRAMGER